MANPVTNQGFGSPQSIYTTGTVRNHQPGTRAVLSDGRVFYYVENRTAAALTVAQLHVTATVIPNHSNTTVTAAADMTVGSFTPTVTVGATAVTAGDYDEGYLSVDSDGGAGRIYKIKETPAIASSGTGVVTLYDSVQVAGDASTALTMTKNMWRDPQQSNTTVSEVPVGVPLVTIAAGDSTTQFGWMQTWGPCPVLADEAVTAEGQAVTIGTGTAGAVEEDDTATTVSQEFLVGYNLQPLVDADFNLIYLMIAP